jgi:hypothetical protein
MQNTTDTLRTLIYGSSDGLTPAHNKAWVLAYLKLLLNP